MLIWNIKDSFQMHGKRFIYENTPAEVATEFNKVDVTEEKPESLNVDAKKKEYISKLGKDPQAPGYAEALAAINERANLLKKKQEYFKARLEAVNIINKVTNTTDNSSYLNSLSSLKKLETLAKLKADSKVTDTYAYEDAIKGIKDSNDKYLNALVAETRSTITEFNKKLASLNAPDNKVKISDLTNDAIALRNKGEEFKAAKAKGFEGSTVKLAQEQNDIEDDYFAAFNLYNAKLANVQLEGSDDKEKQKQARDWLAGAESLQNMRLAKASAWESYKKLSPDKQAETDAATHPARQAWDKAKSLEKTNYAEAAKLYQTAKGEYDKALEGLETDIKAAKDKATKAFNSIPASVSSSDATNFSDAGYFKDFQTQLRADKNFNKEWTDAAGMEKTNSAEAIKLYAAAEKKYQALAASVNLLNGMMADINRIATYDSQAERTKRNAGAADLTPDRYRQALNALYAASKELYYSPHLAGNDMSKAIAAYQKIKDASYYVKQGNVTLDTKLPETPKAAS